MRKRCVRIWARLTEDELETITRRIRKTGLSREAYIRSVLLGSVPREKPDERFYAIMGDLAVIARNAGQLAKSAAELGIDALALQREADNWSRFQLEVRQKFLMPDKR